MNLQTFYDNFEMLAEAPNGVQKLRELILQLAVQGKLVPQDPSDEPATILLEKIARARGKLLKQDIWVSESAKPFEIPPNWTWALLGDTLLKLTDGTHNSPPNTERGDYKYISAKNIKPDGIQLSNVTYIDAEMHKEIYSRCNPEYGDILYIKDGATTGIVTINQLKEEFSMLSSVALLKLPGEIYNRYLLYCLRSPFFYSSMRGDMTGVAITRVTLAKLNKALIPVAPLKEQKRIVAKVDQLMKLCDELEERQQMKREARLHLNQSALEHLLSASTPEEFNTHWQRICDNFDLLYDTPETIGKLRQSILQLAVQGKLVPQDPNDEPASQLLEKVLKERGKLPSKSNLLFSPNNNINQTNLPKGWVQIAMGDIVDTRLGKMLDKQKNKGEFFHYLRNTNVQWLRFDLTDVKKMRFESNELEEYEVRVGDLLICEGGEPGRCAVWDGQIERVFFQKALHRVRPLAHISPWFILYRILADAKSGYLEKHFTGATIKHLTGQELARYSFPLPPLKEQKRIVAKLDQLMKLCDELEAKLKQSQTLSSDLMRAMINHLFSSATEVENISAALSA